MGLVIVDKAAPGSLPVDLFKPNTSFREPDSSILPHIAIYVVQVIFLVAPPFPARRSLFLLTLTSLAIYAQLHPHISNDPGTVQPFAISWSYYLATVEKVLFSIDGQPEKSFWRIDRPAREATAFVGFGLSKLRWALMLIFNQRGIRWNYEVKNIPQLRSSADKLPFILARAFDFVFYILSADIVFQLGSRILFVPSEGIAAGTIDSKYLTMRHTNPFWQFAKSLTFGSTPYFMVSAQYALLSIVAVALNLSQPGDWPPLFGRLADVTCIRDFWGKFWHQQLRRTLTTFSTKLVDVLGIRRGTTLSSQSQVWIAFLISGFFHTRSHLNMPAPINISDAEKCNGFFVFFVCQAAAITFEDGMQWIWRQVVGKQHGAAWERRVSTLAGYVWVTGVLWYTLPFAGDTFLRMRLGVESLLPFPTVFGGLITKYVPVPPLVINWR